MRYTLAPPQRSHTTASSAAAGGATRRRGTSTGAVGLRGSDMSRDYTAADFAERRDRMVRTQIEARGVTDVRVLAALRAVPRELFVPLAEQAEAYDDRAL